MSALSSFVIAIFRNSLITLLWTITTRCSLYNRCLQENMDTSSFPGVSTIQLISPPYFLIPVCPRLQISGFLFPWASGHSATHPKQITSLKITWILVNTIKCRNLKFYVILNRGDLRMQHCWLDAPAFTALFADRLCLFKFRMWGAYLLWLNM